jgi:chemosensory pili system protein ChpA (sensor histidine kinase/response regulator)
MSAQQDAVALDWIKGEIRDTLTQAQQALDVVAETPDDATGMRLCLTAIHQVHGTLKMVELPGAVQLAAEMEELAQALMNNSVPDVAHAQEILMQNILQLPGYLDRVQQQHSENPEFIAATVDDLRVARGEQSEQGDLKSTDLAPNIELINAPPDSKASENYNTSGGNKVIRKLRQRYQQSLVQLLNQENQRENLGILAKILNMLAKATRVSPVSHLSQLGIAVVEGIANGSIELDAKLASALRHIDPVLKNLVENGEAGLQKPVSEELLTVLIQKIANDAKETSRALAIKQTYLKEAVTREWALVDRTLGPDDETMSVVANVLLEELVILKDKLDLYVRSSPRNKADIEGLVPGMVKFDSSMTVVGMSQNQKVLQQQVELLRAALAEADEPSESLLMGIAAAFIELETSLAPMVVQDGSEIETEMAGDLSEAEADVIKEVRNGLAQCRDCVIDFISSDWDKDKITELPGQLMDLRGGLLVVNQTRPANTLLACAEYVSKGILATSDPPDLAAMDDLADSITSIDYYFERYLDKPEPYLQMLEVAEMGVARLGYAVEDSVDGYQQARDAAGQSDSAKPITDEPLALEEVPVEPVSEDFEADGPGEPAAVEIQPEDISLEELELEEQPEENQFEIGSVELDIDSQVETQAEEQISEDEFVIEDIEMPATGILSEDLDVAGLSLEELDGDVESEAEGTGEDDVVDVEIVEIFVSEVTEVLETIAEFYSTWRINSADQEALTEIRRAFHTLKGSGRMVGATVVGELAWAIENMLNRVLDETIVVSSEMTALLDDVLERIPVLMKAFENNEQHSVQVADLEDKANRIAKGESLSPGAEIARESMDGSAKQEEAKDEADAIELFKEVEGKPIKAEPHELDPELVAIFVEEAAELMQIYGEFVARAKKGPISITPELRAALHTLKGSSSMAEISSISPVAVQLDGLTNHLFERSIKTDKQLTSLLKRGHELISKAIGNLDSLTPIPIDGTETLLAELVDAWGAAAESDEETESGEQAGQTFTFDGIHRLLDSDEILERWQGDELRGLVAELDLLSKRSDKSGDTKLKSLVSCLRKAYGPLSISDPPTEVAVASLKRGHDHLIETLDCIAAGQKVEINEAIITTLKNLSESDEDDLLPAEPIQFVQEAWLCLNNMNGVIQQWKDDIQNALELEKLHDSVNSLSKLAQNADERIMVELCDRILLVCSGLKNGDLTPVDSDPALFESCHQQLVDFLGALQQNEAILPNESLLVELEQRAETAAAEAPEEDIQQPVAEAEVEEPQEKVKAKVEEKVEEEVEEKVEEEIDEEILSIFLEEADEIIESIDQSILQWNDQRADSVPLNNLLRYLHTLKGGARLAGLSSLGEFAHNFETDLIGVQQGKVPVDDSLFADLNKGQDEISRRIQIYRKIVAGQASVEERDSVTQTPAAQGAEGVDATQAEEPDTVTSTAAAQSTAAAAAKPEDQPRPAKAAPQQQEVVRVSAELLDDLAGMAGESSITRGLIEQQINDFDDNIDELELTITHVRDQVRRLEIETESRETMFRGRGLTESNSQFDELEMDQYTQLQEISRSLAESVSDLLEHKETLKSKSRDAEILLQQQSRLTNEMQEGLTRTTMVPFSRMIPRLRRIVRQISDELGKKIRFDAFNVEGDLDRNVLERIVAPLEHMLRNAVDHGIEAVEVRKKLGKSEEGRISLRLSREAGNFVLQISDDGSGIDVHKVRRKAIEKGMLAEDAQVSNQEVLSYVMRAGFSTAEKLTQISGRGVGMDVVDSELKQLGGTVTIDSTPGKGTEFTIRIPFTVSITRALMVIVSDEMYAIPLNSIEGIVRVSPYELEAYYQPDAPKFEYANQGYKLVYMGRVLEKSGDPNLEGQIALLPVLLARTGDSAVAFQVDRVIGSREVVVKSIGPQFNEVTGISGASILGDGSVVVILDLMALLRSSYESDFNVDYVTDKPVEVIERVRTVMVVDDSVTVRKVTSRLIERQGWDVVLAKDGIDAMDQLQEILPDIMLLDIEMPRMDGFEVLRTVRRDEDMKDLPIVMITSRTGEKHRNQAIELGVDRYLGKPFQENDLIDIIEEVLVEKKG